MRKTILNLEASRKNSRQTIRPLATPLHISTDSPSEKTQHNSFIYRSGQTTSTADKSLDQYFTPHAPIQNAKPRLNTSHDTHTKLNRTLNSTSTKNIETSRHDTCRRLFSKYVSSTNAPENQSSLNHDVTNINPIEFTVQMYQHSHQTPKRTAPEPDNSEMWKEMVTKKLSKVGQEHQSTASSTASMPLLSKIRRRVQIEEPTSFNRPNTSQNYNKLNEHRSNQVDTILDKVRENVGDIAKSDLERTIRHTSRITNQFLPDNHRREAMKTAPMTKKMKSGLKPRGNDRNITAEEMEAYELCKQEELKDSIEKMTQNLDDYTQAFYWGMVDMSHINMDGKKNIYKNAQKIIKLNVNPKVESNYRSIIQKRFANSVKRCKEKLERFHMTVDQAAQDKAFSTKPFENPHSEEFIRMCRDGDFNGVQVQVELNRNLVNDFDMCGDTGLHWAAKRGHLDVVTLLLEKGADPDAEDMCQRTPLMLAAKAGYVEIVRALCLAGANALKKSDGKKIAEEYTENEEIKRILQRARSKGLAMLMKVRETTSIRKDDWRF